MTSLTDALANIIGEQLSEVTFVQDYLQLGFDGHRLTVLVPIEVRDHDLGWVSGHPDFRNQLCARIGLIVTGAACLPHHLTLMFEGGSEIGIALNDEVYIGPEALRFSIRDDPRLWVV